MNDDNTTKSIVELFDEYLNEVYSDRLSEIKEFFPELSDEEIELLSKSNKFALKLEAENPSDYYRLLNNWLETLEGDYDETDEF